MTYLVLWIMRLCGISCREARKDFIGEGRMFFMYKRLFRDIYVRQGVTITADENRFVIPIPDDEYEFAGIEKPSEIK